MYFELWQFLWSCLSFCQKQNNDVLGSKLVRIRKKINPQKVDSEHVKTHFNTFFICKIWYLISWVLSNVYSYGIATTIMIRNIFHPNKFSHVLCSKFPSSHMPNPDSHYSFLSLYSFTFIEFNIFNWSKCLNFFCYCLIGLSYQFVLTDFLF